MITERIVVLLIEEEMKRRMGRKKLVSKHSKHRWNADEINFKGST